MKYMGGKFKLKKELSAIINELKPEAYLEPFCGACWVGTMVQAPKRIFSDLRMELISMWKGLLEGWEPPTCVPFEMHRAAQRGTLVAEGFCSEEEAPTLTGFIFGNCCFGGKWGGTYARIEKGVNADGTAASSVRSLKKTLPSLAGAQFLLASYEVSLTHFPGDVVYCDPPYANTAKYEGLPDMDYDNFWSMVRLRSQKDVVLVSEYSAPSHFVAVWWKDINPGLKNKERAMRRENLYMDPESPHFHRVIDVILKLGMHPDARPVEQPVETKYFGGLVIEPEDNIPCDAPMRPVAQPGQPKKPRNIAVSRVCPAPYIQMGDPADKVTRGERAILDLLGRERGAEREELCQDGRIKWISACAIISGLRKKGYNIETVKAQSLNPLYYILRPATLQFDDVEIVENTSSPTEVLGGVDFKPEGDTWIPASQPTLAYASI